MEALGSQNLQPSARHPSVPAMRGAVLARPGSLAALTPTAPGNSRHRTALRCCLSLKWGRGLNAPPPCGPRAHPLAPPGSCKSPAS